MAIGALSGQIGKITVDMAGSAIDRGVDSSERPESVKCPGAARWKSHVGRIDVSGIF